MHCILSDLNRLDDLCENYCFGMLNWGGGW